MDISLVHVRLSPAAAEDGRHHALSEAHNGGGNYDSLQADRPTPRDSRTLPAHHRPASTISAATYDGDATTRAASTTPPRTNGSEPRPLKRFSNAPITAPAAKAPTVRM